MKKKYLWWIFDAVIVIAALYFGANLMSAKDNFIEDYDYLYEKAVDYLDQEELDFIVNKQKKKEEKTGVKDTREFHVFSDYHGFGIEEINNQKCVYLWICQELNYLEDGMALLEESSSMPYKFIFENDEVVSYEIPKDGSNYDASIQAIFPKSIYKDIINYQMDNTNLKKEIEDFYKN